MNRQSISFLWAAAAAFTAAVVLAWSLQTILLRVALAQEEAALGVRPIRLEWEYSSGDYSGYRFHVYYSTTLHPDRWERMAVAEWPEMFVEFPAKEGFYRLTVESPAGLESDWATTGNPND